MNKFRSELDIKPLKSNIMFQKTFFIKLAIGFILSLNLSDVGAKNHVEDYVVNGNIRTIIVQGNNLDEIHRIAANHFVSNLESDFRLRDKYFAVRNFKTTVGKTKTGYIMSYSLELVPVSKKDKHFRIVDMRGTVIDGIKSKQTAEDINHVKVPKWQKSMSNQYVGMQYLQATCTNASIYHEAFIGFGESKK